MVSPAHTRDAPLLGITYKLLSVCVFTGMAACIKAASDEVPPGEAAFFRSLFAIPVILIWMAIQHDLRTGLKTSHLSGHLWRGIIGSCAMFLGFTGLGLLPLPEVTAIGFAAPIISVILAAMFLGERIRLYRMAAVMTGLVGVVIILAPRFDTNLSSLAAFGALAALGSAFLRATALVFTRRLVETEGTTTIVFYFSLIASVMSLMTLPFGWSIPSPTVAALLITSGILGGIAQILLTNSYRYAPAGVIAPFDYASMILALIVGYFVFAEIPTLPVLAGASLVLAGGLFIIYRERALGLKRGKARSVTPTQG